MMDRLDRSYHDGHVQLDVDGNLLGGPKQGEKASDYFKEQLRQGRIFVGFDCDDDGLNTAVLPSTRLGPSIHSGTAKGKFHGVMTATTPHGLRRTNEDKRRAVQLLLADSEWAKASDRWIAEQCKVSNHLVADVRGNNGNSGNTIPFHFIFSNLQFI
jgi:hypothetical protein